MHQLKVDVAGRGLLSSSYRKFSNFAEHCACPSSASSIPHLHISDKLLITNSYLKDCSKLQNWQLITLYCAPFWRLLCAVSTDRGSVYTGIWQAEEHNYDSLSPLFARSVGILFVTAEKPYSDTFTLFFYYYYTVNNMSTKLKAHSTPYKAKDLAM